MSKEQLSPKSYSPEQALFKISNWCAYQERCQQEVRNKLYEWNLKSYEVEAILAELIGLDLLNEERFAKSYARGKFRIKKWGRNKIKFELRFKKISDYLIKAALQEINEEEYNETIVNLLQKNGYTLNDKNNLIKKAKITKTLLQKGYELDLINHTLNFLQKTH